EFQQIHLLAAGHIARKRFHKVSDALDRKVPLEIQPHVPEPVILFGLLPPVLQDRARLHSGHGERDRFLLCPPRAHQIAPVNRFPIQFENRAIRLNRAARNVQNPARRAVSQIDRRGVFFSFFIKYFEPDIVIENSLQVAIVAENFIHREPAREEPPPRHLFPRTESSARVRHHSPAANSRTPTASSSSVAQYSFERLVHLVN